MPKDVVLRTRVDGDTAALVHVHAASHKISTSEWISRVVQRELGRFGQADALALRAYETQLTLGYMLRSLMIDAMGADAAEAEIQDAVTEATDEAQDELRRAQYLLW